jgi:hypothetical protein
MAVGQNLTATGTDSVVFGQWSKAEGNNAFAAGYAAYATGNHSTALGFNGKAMGQSSLAIGNNCSAYGDYSVAAGRTATATGNYTFVWNGVNVGGIQNTAAGQFVINPLGGPSGFLIGMGNGTFKSLSQLVGDAPVGVLQGYQCSLSNTPLPEMLSTILTALGATVNP